MRDSVPAVSNGVPGSRILVAVIGAVVVRVVDAPVSVVGNQCSFYNGLIPKGVCHALNRLNRLP
jgi:hypothetical protein